MARTRYLIGSVLLVACCSAALAQVPTGQRRPANAAERRAEAQQDAKRDKLDAQQDRRLARLERIAAASGLEPGQVDRIARQLKLGEARSEAEFDALSDRLEQLAGQLAELRDSKAGGGGGAAASQFEQALEEGRFADAEALWSRYEQFAAAHYARQEWARFQAGLARDTSPGKSESIAVLEGYLAYEPRPYNYDEAQALLRELVARRNAQEQQARAATPWLAGSERKAIARTRGKFTALAFAPSGRALLAGGDDGEIELFSLPDGKPVRSFRGLQGAVRSVAVSKDGRQVLAGGSDGTARLWDLASARPLRTLSGHYEAVNSARFSADGEWIITASDDERVLVWNARTGALAQTLIDETVCKRRRREKARYIGSECDLLWNPVKLLAEPSRDGTRVLVRMRSISEQFAFPSGEYLGRPAMEGYYSHKAINAARYSPDGKFIFAENGIYRMGKIFDAQTNREICGLEPVKGADRVASADFSDDGRLLAVGTNEAGIELYRSDCTHLATLLGHGLPVTTVDLSADGRWLASLSQGAEIVMWQDKSVPGAAATVK